MPQRSKRPCKQPGCAALVVVGYCDKHREAAEQRRQDELRADPLRPYYKNFRWLSTRKVVLGRDPLCKSCGLALSTIVHHDIDARIWIQRGGDFYDESNLVGLCEPCHNAITRQRQ
jgi:5-methylcytosine-specific restriction enzyme A